MIYGQMLTLRDLADSVIWDNPTRVGPEGQIVENLLNQIWHLFTVLFDSQALMETLSRPDFLVATFVALNLIIFIETGLFCFLPGDSLLVTAGLVFHNLIFLQGNSVWLLPLLLLSLCVSAIVGDSVGYLIG